MVAAPAQAYKPQDTLSLWWLGEPGRPQRIGDVSLVQGNRAVALAYDAQWLASGFELSADLPLRPGLFVPREKDTAVGAIDDARPDRWGERVINRFEKSPRMSILEYLLFAGDSRFGALGVSQSAHDYLPWPSAPLAKLGSLPDMADAVRKVLANEPVGQAQRRLVRPGVSLGGARPKSLIEIDSEPWLVKFSEGEDMDTELIEHWFHSFAQAAGITLHVENLYGANMHHVVESCFKALARALRVATEIDPRKADAIPSTKGTLGSA